MLNIANKPHVPSVIMLSVIVLIVVAPQLHLDYKCILQILVPRINVELKDPES
jgi:hypothetical protein